MMKLSQTYFFIGIVFFISVTAYSWGFIVDDTYISLRYAQHLSHGQGLTWNVGEAPIEGYTNLLWVIIMSVFEYWHVDTISAIKIIGVMCVFGILYIYWKMSKNMLAFGASAAVLLINPATAIHAVSGLETMLYSLLLVSAIYFAYESMTEANTTPRMLLITTLLLSITRPEGIIVSVVLYMLICLRKSAFDMIMAGYVCLMAIYMFVRIKYFNDIFPLPFYVKVIDGSIFVGLFDAIDAFLYINIFLLVILISIILISRNHKFNSLVFVSFAVILISNVVYIFSTLQMNYTMRYYYPAFVIIYMLSGISISLIYESIRPQKKHIKEIMITVLILVLISSNLIFKHDLVSISPENMERSHIAIGKALNEYSNENLTIASGDAGTIAYYSEWKHIDIIGLNDKFIAHNGIASMKYIKQVHPDIIILVSRDGITPREDVGQKYFIEYSKQNKYELFPSIMNIKDVYYLIPYVSYTVSNEIRESIITVSIESYQR